MVEVTDADIAWAAGLFEGEGCIFIQYPHKVRMSLAMTDLDVVERFCNIVGVGKVKYKKPRDGHKDLHLWEVSNKEDVLTCFGSLGLWFGKRRESKANEAIECLRLNKGRYERRTHCPRGHEYTEENTYRRKDRDASRDCRQCRKIRDQKTLVG